MRTGRIRQRILRLALLPMLLVVPLVLMMAWLWSNEVGYRQLLMKVNTDLAVAQASLQTTQQQYLLRLALVSESSGLRRSSYQLTDSMQAVNRQALGLQLEQLRQQTRLDYIRLLDTDHCDLLRPGHCEYPNSPLLATARAGQLASGVELFSAAQLNELSPALAMRARLALTETERARPTQRQQESRGMMLHFVYPLKDHQGEVVALLVAGLLMNGNVAFVDQLKATVYGEGSLMAGSRGTVTLFLDDVRISTNVPDQQRPGRRALGTRVSEQVRLQVLDEGQPWIDRAFVVSDWYISGYTPITDVYQQRVGMLYTGFLEAPYQAELDHWLGQLFILLALLLLLCGLICWYGARAIFKPVEMMAQVIPKIRAGQRFRMPPLQSRDELTLLAVEFNAMLDQLDAQHDQIQAAATELERKVACRTDDLQQHIQLLNRTREQLVAKGKLAAIGELTAGIAHEINNPAAVILGYLDLMMLELGEAGLPVKDEARLIVEQVGRIRALINNLLQFSRPEEHRAALTAVDLNQLVHDTQLLIKHDLNRKQLSLHLDLRASLPVAASRQLLQQVLINLIVNATQAMEMGGRLTIRSRNWRGKGVLLLVKDTGCGIAPELLGRIFDPFFSQTQGGTGLGLSISYSIIQRMKAEIDVRSRSGIGSCFYIWLQVWTEPVQAGLPAQC